MMREAIFGAAFGIALAVAGFPFTTWQYWLLMLLAVTWRLWPKKERATKSFARRESDKEWERHD